MTFIQMIENIKKRPTFKYLRNSVKKKKEKRKKEFIMKKIYFPQK